MAGGLKAYIKIGKLPGESMKQARADKGYSDLISATTSGQCNWDFSQEHAPTRMMVFSGISVTKYVNGSTPILLIACLKEKLIKEMEIVVENDKGEDFFLLRMKGEVRITTDALSFEGNQMVESITFAGKILEVEHKPKGKKDDINWSDITQKGAEI